MVSMLPGILSAVLSLSLLAQIDAGRLHGRMQGHVVDAAGAPIQAAIRIIQPDTNTVVLRFRAKEDGTFQTDPLVPAIYSVTAFSPGFRRGGLRKVVIKPGEVADLGTIRLDISGCDTPGTNCDYFGEVPDEVKRIVASAHVVLNFHCAVNLDDKGKPVCTEEAGLLKSQGADIRLSRENGAFYLSGVNGAALSAPYPSTLDRSGATYGTDRIAVAGLGRGVDFCVRTERGFISHVFFTEDIENDSRTVGLWYVTRRPR